MIETILCAAAVTIGVEFGWEPNGDGGLEYIVQIDPESLKNLGRGIPLRSDFPRDLQGLETIRFQVGKGKPPQIALAPSPSPPEKQQEKQPAEPAENSPVKLLPAQPAFFEEPSKADEQPKTPTESKSENTTPAEPQTQRPWLLLYTFAGTSIGLATAFFYLLWLHIGMRNSYRMLLAGQTILGKEP